MRATPFIRPMVASRHRAVLDEPAVLRRYTSPCGVTFEAPEVARRELAPPACFRCGSREWEIAERPWGGVEHRGRAEAAHCRDRPDSA